MARSLYERVLPLGSRRRRLFSGMMVVVWEVRNAAVRTRAEWQRRRDEIKVGSAPSRGAAGLAYEEWFFRLPADTSVLAAQRQRFEEWGLPLKVWGLVVDDGGDLAATEKSLRDQSWGLVEVVKVEPGGLAEEFHRLSRDCPNDLAVILRAGDRLRPDALYQTALVTWQDPSLELVYWDDDLSAAAEIWIGTWRADRRVSTLAKISTMWVGPRLKPCWSPDLLVVR